jgi:hypothetical protein
MSATSFVQVRLYMKNVGWFSRLLNQQPSPATVRHIAAGTAVALAIMLTGAAFGQSASQVAPAPETQMSVPTGYSIHQSIDLGGRISNQAGSGAMYNTLVNLQSGPRVLGQSFEMHALPGKKGTLVEDLKAFGSGFGGDPNNFAKLDFSKSKFYEFSGMFRRDRLYSNYDLLGNPNIPSGLTMPIGPANAPTGTLAWPQVNKSPVMFNTVRRMTDTNLTLMPLSTFSVRLGYSHFTMEGPALSPSYTILKYNALLQQYQRNGSDDYLGAIDWRPQPATKITFEMQANHYKADTSYTLDPNGFQVQEADGTPAYLGNYTSFAPYGISVSGACNTTSMGSGYTSPTVYTILSPANKPGGMPIINPACAVVTSYLRTQPTRIWTPTETIRLQSSALKNISMNGNVHYTRGTSDMPAYYENAQGLSTLTTTAGPYLNTANRSVIWTGGYATTQHTVVGADYGIVWQVMPRFSLADQATYSSTHEPGSSIIPPQAALATPAGAGNGTINYSGSLVAGTASLPHGINGTLTYNYYGQEYLINNLTASWDVAARAKFALTYRYSNRNIGQGIPHQGPIPIVVSDPVSGTITINENAGVFNAALHPTKNWDLNGTVEIGYADNAFTAVGQRQFKTYRVHTIYKPAGWATITGSYSDRERHNNTNNNQDVVAAGDANYSGPLNHVDYNRIGSMGVVLTPNERFGVNLNYSYSDVYAATNICFSSGATVASASTPAVPGAATVTSSGAPNLCVGGATWMARDFMAAPTQFGMASIFYNVTDKLHAGAGYTASDVNGSRFFNDARDVNGSMVSLYQSPFVNAAYTLHTGLILKAEYNYFGYGEGGPSGSPLCSLATSPTATISPCASMPYPTGMNEGVAGATAPRTFHASNMMLGVHYEF